MVPLALPEGKHARNPQDRERRTIKVSPEAVMATRQGFRGTPQFAPPGAPGWARRRTRRGHRDQVYVGHGASSGTCAAASIGANPDSLGSSP